MQDILGDETLTTSERLARYEDALKRKGNTLADEEERGEKAISRQIPIIIPSPSAIVETVPSTNVQSLKKISNPTIKKVKQRLPRKVVRKSIKQLIGRGKDSLEVVSW